MKISYIEPELLNGSLRAKGRGSFQNFISITLTVLFALLTIIPFGLASQMASPASSLAAAEPFGFFCGGKDSASGYGMTSGFSSTSWFMVEPDATSRKWTLQEAFGSNIKFVNYHGEGDAPGQVGVKAVGTDRLGSGYDAIKSRVNGERTIENCLSDFTSHLSSLFLGLPIVITAFSGTIAGYAFNPSFICGGIEQSTNCLDLVGVIGGSGGTDGGIIGGLTSSIYLPLSIMVIAFAAFWVVKKGLAERKFREAFIGLAWVLGSFILGLIFLFNPAMIARAPMQLSSGLAACVIGSFSGENCLAGPTGPKIDTAPNSGQVCSSSAGGSSASMSFIVNSLSCNIWKAFVLEPYSQASFGMSYEQLNTDNGNANLKKAITAAGFKPEDFCVNLGSEKSASQMNFSLTELTGGPRECNIAAYQLYLQSYASMGGNDKPVSIGSYDARWNKIIQTMAQDEGLWRAWTHNDPGDMVFVSIISSVAGSTLVIFVSVLALVYYIGGTVLMAFAPLFMLFGLHPQRGKKIMFGWLEKIVSNILKYVASALFLIVSITLLGSVLGSVQNPWLSLILILILTVALFMYRKEIIDLIGKANMGGEQLTSKMSGKFGKKAAQLATGAIGGAIGAKMAGGSLASGATAAVKRDLKRGTGILAQTARQYDRTGADNLSQAREEKRTLENQSSEANSDFRAAELDKEQAAAKVAQTAVEANETKGTFDATVATLASVNGDRRSGISELQQGFVDPAGAVPSVAGPLMAEMLRIIDQMKDLTSKKASLMSAGVTSDDPRITSIDASMSEFGSRRAEIASELRHQVRDDGKPTSLANKSDMDIVKYSENAFSRTDSGEEVSKKLAGGTYGDALQNSLDARQDAFGARLANVNASEKFRHASEKSLQQEVYAKETKEAVNNLDSVIDESVSKNKVLHLDKMKETVEASKNQSDSAWQKADVHLKDDGSIANGDKNTLANEFFKERPTAAPKRAIEDPPIPGAPRNPKGSGDDQPPAPPSEGGSKPPSDNGNPPRGGGPKPPNNNDNSPAGQSAEKSSNADDSRTPLADRVAAAKEANEQRRAETKQAQEARNNIPQVPQQQTQSEVPRPQAPAPAPQQQAPVYQQPEAPKPQTPAPAPQQQAPVYQQPEAPRPQAPAPIAPAPNKQSPVSVKQEPQQQAPTPSAPIRQEQQAPAPPVYKQPEAPKPQAPVAPASIRQETQQQSQAPAQRAPQKQGEKDVPKNSEPKPTGIFRNEKNSPESPIEGKSNGIPEAPKGKSGIPFMKRPIAPPKPPDDLDWNA